jgi:hypothetical protein
MEISTFLIGIAILLVLFFVFREINLWYFKINERIELAQKQNMLLEIIAEHLKGGALHQSLDYKKSIIDQKGTSNSDVSERDIIDSEAFSTLSEGEKHTVNTYMNHGLSKGNKLVIHKKTRKFNSLDDNDWNKILKNSKEDDWLIISENKIAHKS